MYMCMYMYMYMYMYMFVHVTCDMYCNICYLSATLIITLMSSGFATLAALGAAAAFGAAVALIATRRAQGRRRPRGPGGQRRSGKYCAGMIKANPEMIAQYRQLHDNTWHEVMARMYASNMRDFTVWLHEESGTMFHQFVYIGDDFDSDMALVAADPIVRFWWTYCEPCQTPLHWKGPPPSQGGQGAPGYEGQWWAPLQQVNHCGAWSTSWSTQWPDPDFEPTHPQRLTSTKDSPPAVHNRTGAAAGWTSYTQPPFVAA